MCANSLNHSASNSNRPSLAYQQVHANAGCTSGLFWGWTKLQLMFLLFYHHGAKRDKTKAVKLMRKERVSPRGHPWRLTGPPDLTCSWGPSGHEATGLSKVPIDLQSAKWPDFELEVKGRKQPGVRTGSCQHRHQLEIKSTLMSHQMFKAVYWS